VEAAMVLNGPLEALAEEEEEEEIYDLFVGI